MGVRNSKYGPGLMVDNNGQCMVQLGSCYNPYFSSQFQSNNSSQSCYVKTQNNSLLNAYKTADQQQKLGTMSTYSCELPRTKNYIPIPSPSFYKPASPAITNYFGTRANYLKSPIKSISPFYQKSLVSLSSNIAQQPLINASIQYTNSIVNKFANKFYKQQFSKPTILQMNALPQQIQTTNNQMQPAHVINQLALPKPNQVTLRSSKGMTFPLPLAMPLGQPLIENFNPGNTLESFRNETVEKVSINEESNEATKN